MASRSMRAGAYTGCDTQTMSTAFRLRPATLEDASSLHRLIALSVRGLMRREYTTAQLEAALDNWLGLDTQLISDGTYFAVECADPEHDGLLVGCGGWSRRKTPYGSDHRAGREDALLDPSRDAAKIRAFFVHPEWARRGIGRLLLEHCEASAAHAGFTRLEMGATLSGVPLYSRFGYVAGERVNLPLPGNDSLAIVMMSKKL
jgi:ribosomal protein S18 acetylase RimI-like enzyme